MYVNSYHPQRPFNNSMRRREFQRVESLPLEKQDEQKAVENIEKQEDQIQTEGIWKSLDFIDPIPKFWRLDKNDMLTFAAMLSAIALVWVTTASTGSFSAILDYWDGPNYLYAGATLYNIPRTNPWTRGFRYDPSYFACHLPGYPLVIRFCAYLCFKNYRVGFYLSIIICSLLFCYCFRRALLATKCVSNPTLTTCLASIVPMRFVIYHSVGASEALFMAFVSLAVCFYRFDKPFLLLMAIWGGCITRIEGMAIGATFGLCYLLRFRITKALSMFGTFIAPFCLVVMHQWRFGDPLAYIHFNKDHANLVQWPPFSELRGMKWHTDELYAHSFIQTYALMVIGTVLVYSKSIPIGIFASIFAAYVAFLHHIDIFRYGLPCALFAFLVGFDGMISSKGGKVACLCCAPFYLVILVVYVKGQIHSNKAWPHFMQMVWNDIAKL